MIMFSRSSNSQPEEEASYSKLKDLPKATKLVFSRLPFLFITLGACLEHFTVSVAGAFLPKIIQTQFYVPPGKAALLYGVIVVPCAFVANLLGEQHTQYCMLHCNPKCFSFDRARILQ